MLLTWHRPSPTGLPRKQRGSGSARSKGWSWYRAGGRRWSPLSSIPAARNWTGRSPCTCCHPTEAGLEETPTESQVSTSAKDMRVHYMPVICFFHQQISPNCCCSTLFSRCLFLSKKVQAQRNQQSPNRPCFTWARLMLSGKRAGDRQISWRGDMKTIQNHQTTCSNPEICVFRS